MTGVFVVVFLETYHDNCIETVDVAYWLLTGTVSQVLSMNRSLPDDDKVMLQLLGTTGTVRET